MITPMSPTLSRRSFLEASAAAGGGLLISFSLPASLAKQLSAPPPPAPPSEFAPNAFIRIDTAGQVTLVMHKVEMGQGTYTAMPMILAEELEADLSQVRLEHAPADDTRYWEPSFGVQETGGSTSVRGNFEPLRRAGATARTMLVAAAAATWKVDPNACRAEHGTVIHGPSGRSLGYGQRRAEGPQGLPPDRHVREATRYAGQGRRHDAVRYRRPASGHEIRERGGLPGVRR